MWPVVGVDRNREGHDVSGVPVCSSYLHRRVWFQSFRQDLLVPYHTRKVSLLGTWPFRVLRLSVLSFCYFRTPYLATPLRSGILIFWLYIRILLFFLHFFPPLWFLLESQNKNFRSSPTRPRPLLPIYLPSWMSTPYSYSSTPFTVGATPWDESRG